MNVVETGGIVTHARRAAQLIPAPLGPDSDNRVRIETAGRAACVAALLLIATSACAPALVATRPSSPVVVAAVTWNTNAGRGDLPRLVGDLERGLISPPADAYLLLLQETAEDELEAVSAPRRWSTCFVPVRGIDGRVRGNAVVSNLVLRTPRAVPLPRERQSRAAATARIDIAGHELFVASVHLENRVSWWRGGLFSETARHRQVDGLLRALPADTPGILGGDLNTWLGPTEPAWRALARRFADTPDWPRSPTLGNRLVLDHLLMDLPAGWSVTRRVLADDYGSDHHPVVALVSAP
jgi:endonuclease/exonuclease/phosphatase family metal-dependent hydrolase